MTPSALSLVLYAAWTLLLLTAIAALRIGVTLASRRPASGFAVSGEDVSHFSGRLCRAHANCYENLPAFAAIVLVAMVTGQAQITDASALFVVTARIGQSVIHLISTRNVAVNLRFVFFALQVGIQISWTASLLRAGL